MFQTTSTTTATGSKAANDGWDVDEDEWAPLEEAKPVSTATQKAPASPLSDAVSGVVKELHGICTASTVLFRLMNLFFSFCLLRLGDSVVSICCSVSIINGADDCCNIDRNPDLLR